MENVSGFFQVLPGTSITRKIALFGLLVAVAGLLHQRGALYVSYGDLQVCAQVIPRNQYVPEKKRNINLLPYEKLKCFQLHQHLFKDSTPPRKPSASIIQNAATATSFGNSDAYVNKLRDSKTSWVLIHLPKAGGTTIADILKKGAKSNVMKKPKSFSQLCKDCDDFLKLFKPLRRGRAESYAFDCRRGYGVHKLLGSRSSVFYVMVFRNVVERVVSNFYYNRKMYEANSKYSANKWYQLTDDLEDFYRFFAERSDPLTENYSVRQLVHMNSPLLFSSAETCCGSNTNLSNVPPITEREFHSANYTLHNEIGLVVPLTHTKQAQNFINFIFSNTSLPEKSSNVNPHKAYIAPRVAKEIEKRNKWDVLLYKEAIKIADKQWDALKKFSL